MKNKKLWIFIALIILVVFLNHMFGWSEYLGNTENLTFLETLIDENLAAAIAVYLTVTIIGSVVLALPGVTFAIVAGLLFGPLLGTVLCTVAATLGASLAFLAGRFFLRDSILELAAMKNKYLKKWLFDESGKNQLFVLMITRLVPLFPFNLQNFAYGVTDIRFVTYAIGSFVFMIPGTAMYTVGTAGLADAENRVLYIGIALAIAVLVIGTGMILKKKYIGEETDAGE
mgnify:CR=1 FL=1